MWGERGKGNTTPGRVSWSPFDTGQGGNRAVQGKVTVRYEATEMWKNFISICSLVIIKSNPGPLYFSEAFLTAIGLCSHRVFIIQGI